uniref:Uncharacterized protein n=1 Tax=Rhizophora mucronata TaxID=61149 RepID=A0A2P2QMF6_RHIMU
MSTCSTILLVVSLKLEFAKHECWFKSYASLLSFSARKDSYRTLN